MESHNVDESQKTWHPQNHVLTDDSTTEPRSTHGGKGTDDDEQCGLDVQDLGWNHETEQIPPLANGINNAEIWTLVRRFNKQIFRVRSTDQQPLTDLDMNDASGENVSTERLRAHVERLYMTIAVTLYSFYKHIVRLRSWNEKSRTLSFLAAYTVSWLTDSVALVLTCFCMVLMTHPPARDVCFPPVPPALVDSKSGVVKRPLAGKLGSNSITGAPEKHPEEAVEQEAHSFMMSISKMMMSVTSDSHTQNDDALPQPSALAAGIADVQNTAGESESNSNHDKTKEPVSRAVESFEIHPAIRILPDLIDNWERFENALSPTPPFPLRQPRLTLATCLLPLVLVFGFATWDTIAKGMGFVAGFGFFGGPIITYCVTLIDDFRPGWRQNLQLRNTILRGVPTNAQLAVTILRVGERNRGPLPPPPNPHQSPSLPNKTDDQHLSTHGGSQEDTQAAISPESDQEDSRREGGRGDSKPKTTQRVINVIKRVVKGGIQPVLKISKATGPAGGIHARGWLGALDAPLVHAEAGPVRFPARYNEENGNAYITTTATSPSLSWRSVTDDTKSAWTVPLDSIVELSKVGGTGWKRKFVVAWAADHEVADGLVLKTNQGREFYLTAITMRDEVFNRLLSIGSQTWEIC